ncbi:zinc finger protein 64-like [Maniola jurtina]|uniref:zinc finger protein 64-like n=1 Tax=Maniola jurtina TaxID=191418 RepID=UPI001E68E4DA|nr:zinc finger protein 64-like [Maniola jurtina]
MAMRCCVPFCKTTAEVVSESEEITFHEFPREVHLRAAWLRALGKQDTLLPEPAVVCSQHFLNDDIYETESGSRRIRTGAIPSPVLVCMICLDSRSKLFLMSKYQLEEAYEHLVGHPLCGQGKLKQTLCVQCAQRLVNFSAFRDKSLRARSLMIELLDRHEVITIRHVKLISRVKYQLQSDIVSAVSEPDYCDVYIAHSDADGRTELDATAATDEAVAVKREAEPAAAQTELYPFSHMIPKPESSGDCEQASVAPSVLATNHGNEEHPTDTHDELDILSFESNTNILENSGKSQDPLLKLKESLAKISDNINLRTARPNVLLKNEHNSQDISCTQLGNYTDQMQYICDVCQKIFQRKSSLVTHIRAHTYANTFSCKLRERKFTQSSSSLSPRRTHAGDKSFVCKLCNYKCTVNSSLVSHMRTHTGEKPFACKLCKYKCTENGKLITIRHVKLISRVKYQLQSDIVSAVSEPDYCDVYIAHSDADGRTELDATAATDEAVAVKREAEPAAAQTELYPFSHMIPKPESSGDCEQASVAPSVLATNHGNEEHPTDTDDEFDILSFENNTNIFEYSGKSQDPLLKLKESLQFVIEPQEDSHWR